ncbi:MAG: hypothetical protein JSU88_00015 [Nitrospinaceae bacterium]|jgi:hypothetical protein|nr:MAG: hypothetical protein JSU88_00015 [Nitrospinaceae bacterium]
MTDDEVFEKYGEVPLHFSHYYNFVFIFKSERLENGGQIYLQQGGTMEKVSAMVVDVQEPVTLNEKAESDFAYIKSAENQVVWKHGEPHR